MVHLGLFLLGCNQFSNGGGGGRVTRREGRGKFKIGLLPKSNFTVSIFLRFHRYQGSQ